MLLTLVRRARRRLICNDLLARGANAFSAALAAFILLLLLGTQVLNWHWLAIIPAAALSYGLFRAWRSIPSDYVVAQILDSRLSLLDTLSTALYFDHPIRRAKVSEDIRKWQFSRAESAAAAVDPRHAIPWRMPRGVYAMAALFLVASSLFALRYGLSRRLDLQPPLATILQQTFGGSDPVREAATKKKNSPRPPDLQDTAGISVSNQDEKAADLDAAPENALNKTEVPNVDNSNAVQAKADRSKSDEGDPIAGDDPDGQSEEGQTAGGENAGEGQQGANKSKEGQQSAANQQQGSAGDKNSLLQKFKEAMQNLLSKMKQNPGGGSKQQSAETAQSGKQGKQQQGSGKQNGSQSQKQQSGGEQADSQDGQPGEESESSQAQTKGAGQSNEQQASKQPGSGVGREDGSKDLKLAEQMAAMGKLSEIIGKRSASVTGEAMVEVQNTSQQLTTRYEGRNAVHAETGGEIGRDEVPVALQSYVQEYFEQVRKQKK